MIVPVSACVRALNALQNSMMLTPCWPSAGPTGGAGFAAPAGICSLINVRTFFAIARRTRIQRCGFAAAALLGALTLCSPAQAAFPGPNGRIFFTAHSSGAPEPDVWSIEPDGSGLVDLTDLPGGPGSGQDPSVAPSGLVAFTVGAGPAAEIWTMAADGSAPTRLTANGVADRMPAVSPDGARIAYATDSGGPGGFDLWTMRSDGGGAAALLLSPGDDLDPAYLASGDYVFSSSAVGPSGDFDIAAATVAGAPHSTANSITFRSAADETHPALPPDRVRLAYAQSSGGQSDIRTAYTLDGTDEFPLAADPLVAETMPAFSPDGTKIVYSTPTGLVVASAGGANPQPLATPGADLAADPDWAVGKDRLAPETTITKRPHRRTRKRTARFAFGSSEAGSSFECRLDRAGFAPCVAPVKYRRLKRGRHRFEVRAIDAAGNADPSPATAVFKVRPKR